MTPPVALRYARIPLTHGSDAIPAVGFGTLIPDPLATRKLRKPLWKSGFDIPIVRNDTAMKKRLVMRCRQRSRRGRRLRYD
jgi:hypothetical protein